MNKELEKIYIKRMLYEYAELKMFLSLKYPNIYNEFFEIEDISSTKKGCGKEIKVFGDIVECGGVDNWLCPECEKSTKNGMEDKKSHAEVNSLEGSPKTDIRKSEPLSERGENPCVKIHQDIKKEIDKDYLLDDGGEKQ